MVSELTAKATNAQHGGLYLFRHVDADSPHFTAPRQPFWAASAASCLKENTMSIGNWPDPMRPDGCELEESCWDCPLAHICPKK